MKITIFNGSPRKDGNTAALIDQITKEFRSYNTDPKVVTLFDKNIKGCSNCGSCQGSEISGHCTIKDDMSEIYGTLLNSELVIIASPIYMWQLTPCTLAFLNRMHALQSESYNRVEGKRLALAMTMGDGSECSDSAISGIVDFCEYYHMDYRGMIRIPYAKRAEIMEGKYEKAVRAFVDKSL